MYSCETSCVRRKNKKINENLSIFGLISSNLSKLNQAKKHFSSIFQNFYIKVFFFGWIKWAEGCINAGHVIDAEIGSISKCGRHLYLPLVSLLDPSPIRRIPPLIVLLGSFRKFIFLPKFPEFQSLQLPNLRRPPC